VNFFIRRPIFAMSIALVMIMAGAICMQVLPIAQYPPLVPPQVQVSTQYIGAGADVVASTVATPLEEKINGAAGMIYMSSTSTNNGDAAITVTFEVGFRFQCSPLPLHCRRDFPLRSNRCKEKLAWGIGHRA
jgi:multidrug efflux pump subunit AcrB